MRGFLAALSFFTWLPVPPVDATRDTARRALLAFPWVGLGLGLAAAAPAALARWWGGGAPLAAVLGLATLAGLTGAMHLDGLADTADGLGSRRPAGDALAIMRRSDIGPMGVAALVLVLLTDAAALASPRLDAAGLVAALAVAPMAGRASALLGTWTRFPPAHTNGFGRLFSTVTTTPRLAFTGAAVLAVAFGAGCAAGGVRGGVVLVAGPAIGWAVSYGWIRHLLRRLGGLTGDTFGSLIEITQTAVLVAAALAW